MRSVSITSKNNGIALMSTVILTPLPRLTTWIIRCSTSSWSVIVHISVMSLIKALLTFVGNIVADNDWFPFSSVSTVVVSCAGYCLPVKSVTYICCLLSSTQKDTHDCRCLVNSYLIIAAQYVPIV